MATFIPWLGLMFVSKGHQLVEVKQKASEAFFKFRVRKTGGGTGIIGMYK